MLGPQFILPSLSSAHEMNSFLYCTLLLWCYHRAKGIGPIGPGLWAKISIQSICYSDRKVTIMYTLTSRQGKTPGFNHIYGHLAYDIGGTVDHWGKIDKLTIMWKIEMDLHATRDDVRLVKDSIGECKTCIGRHRLSLSPCSRGWFLSKKDVKAFSPWLIIKYTCIQEAPQSPPGKRNKLERAQSWNDRTAPDMVF